MSAHASPHVATCTDTAVCGFSPDAAMTPTVAAVSPSTIFLTDSPFAGDLSADTITITGTDFDLVGVMPSELDVYYGLVFKASPNRRLLQADLAATEVRVGGVLFETLTVTATEIVVSQDSQRTES